MCKLDQFLEWVEAGRWKEGTDWRIERKKGWGVAAADAWSRAGDSNSWLGTSAWCAVGPSRGCKKGDRKTTWDTKH